MDVTEEPERQEGFEAWGEREVGGQPDWFERFEDEGPGKRAILLAILSREYFL